MINDLPYISVRIYRKEDDEVLIKGSGLLFKDCGVFYVLTAYHCMEKKDVDGTIIKCDISKAEIVFYHGRQLINVIATAIVDYDDKEDWILLKVEQPEVSCSSHENIRFSKQAEIGARYESYPYISVMKGLGRYTELTAVNVFGYFHISDNVAGGRYTADMVLKGGSGAGIMREEDDIIYCYGLMKETLPDGALDDIFAVNLDGIEKHLSPSVFKSLSKLELKQRLYDKQQSLINDIQQEALSSNETGLRELTIHLLDIEVPALIEGLRIKEANEILAVIEKHCSSILQADNRLSASCFYNKGLCYNIMGEYERASDNFHNAFLKDSSRPSHIEHEIKYQLHKDNSTDVDKLVDLLPATNHIRLAIQVVKSDIPKVVFLDIQDDIRQQGSFREIVLEMLTVTKSMDISWIYEDYVPQSLDNLTYGNLKEWLFLISYYRWQLKDYLLLKRIGELPDKDIYREAFRTISKFVDCANETPLKDNMPIVHALYCYWGFLLDDQDRWMVEFDSINQSEIDDDHRVFFALLYASMLSVRGKYAESYLYLAEKCFRHDATLLIFIINLSGISKEPQYLIQYLEEHKKDNVIFELQHANALAGLSIDLPKDKYMDVMAKCSFADTIYRQVLVDIYSLKEGAPVDVSGYSAYLPQLKGNLLAASLQIMSANGMLQEAVVYLENQLKEGMDASGLEQTYILLLQRDKMLADRLFRHLQTIRKENSTTDLNYLLLEYNMSLEMTDFANAFKLISLIIERCPDNEYYFAGYVDLAGKEEPEKLHGLIPDILSFQFTKIHLITAVYKTLAENGHVTEAAEFIYKYVIALDDEYLSTFFDNECIMGWLRDIANDAPDTISDGGFATIQIEGRGSETLKIKGDTIMGSALCGLQKGTSINVELAGETRTIEIKAILNKYGYQHSRHLNDVMNSGGNGYITPIHFDSKHPEELLKKLEKLSSSTNNEKDAYDEYARGNRMLMQMVSPDDIVGDYYKYLFSPFKLLVEPCLVCKSRKPNCIAVERNYYLDFTSLLLLFEFHLLHPDVVYPHKFHLSSLIVEIIKSYRKNLHVIASYSLYEAMKHGHLHHFDNQYNKDMDLRIDALEKWIENHCVVLSDVEVLKVSESDHNVFSQLFKNVYISLIGENKKDNVLISEDMAVEKAFHLPLPIITTETYIYDMLGIEIGRKFSIFLCENDCLGANLPYQYIYDQFFLMEEKEKNKMQNIIDFRNVSMDVNNLLTACHDILRDAYNNALAQITVKTLLENYFSWADTSFFKSGEWSQMITHCQSYPICQRYIVPILNEIAHLRINSSNNP